MMNVNLESFRSKLLSTSFTLGVCGGLYISALINFKSQYNEWNLVLQLLTLVVIGLISGYISKRLLMNGKNFLLKSNADGNLILADQKIFFLTILVMVAAHFLNSSMNEWNQFSAVLVTGGVFIVCLANGIFDISTQISKALLVAGVVPVSFSFILAYSMGQNDSLVIMVWILGLLFSLSFLLILNGLQLNSQIFKTKDINVANLKRIRGFNSWAVTVFFILCLVIIGFRKIVSIGEKIILQIINWTYTGLEKFTIWIFSNPQSGSDIENTPKPLPETNFEVSEKPVWEMIFVLTIIIILLAVTVRTIIKIKRSIVKTTNKSNKYTDNYNEFGDESEVVREKLKLNLQNKFKYTLDALDKIEDSGEKVRYLYGFVLERLYHYKINISASDTPEEIINKILTLENGQDLADKGLIELTAKYHRVRYGNKKVDLNQELHHLGKAMEKAIRELVVESSEQ